MRSDHCVQGSTTWVQVSPKCNLEVLVESWGLSGRMGKERLQTGGVLRLAESCDFG